MNISLAVGVLMLAAKWTAFLLTGSSVIFSDAAESVVHIIAVWFAWHAVRVAAEPPDNDHHFGHEKIGAISAAVEGALITIAAVVIIVSAAMQLIIGVELQKLDVGIAITAGAGLLNLVLAVYLIRLGKSSKSLTVEANGQHVMTDVWTSLGAILGLGIASLTELYILDPIIAILFGANIIREGVNLIRRSNDILMDKTNPELFTQVQHELDVQCKSLGISYHRLRLRMSGARPNIDFHLVLNDHARVIDAHAIATKIENHLIAVLDTPNAVVISHIEPTTHPLDHE